MTKDLENNFVSINQIKEVIAPEEFVKTLQTQAGYEGAPRQKKARTRTQKATGPGPVPSGTFQVIRYDYDYGDDVLELPANPPFKSEFRAAVYLPKDTEEAHPVVIFLHGRHHVCYSATLGREPKIQAWPCPPNKAPIPSHEGYSTAATELASHGYVVVSLSANAIYGIGSKQLPNLESTSRAHLILAHLDLLTEANKGNCPDLPLLKGRLDLNNIGLMGHSRGGEGVARTITLNRLLKRGYGIPAALLLGGTSYEGISVPDTHTAFIHPFLDSDSKNLNGQQSLDLSRLAFNDNVLRSSVLLMGANHNYFNEIWSPGYPLGEDDALAWGDLTVPRLTQEEQRLLGAFYIAGFFRLTLGGEQQFLPFFDGSSVSVPLLPKAEVRSSAHVQRSNTYNVQSFETLYSDDASSTPGKWAWTIRLGEGEIKKQASFSKSERYTHHLHHSFLNLKNTIASSPAKLELYPRDNEDPVDISRYTHLSFYVTHLLEENPQALVKLDIALGNLILNPAANQIMLLPVVEIVPGVETFLLQQILVPLSNLNIDFSQPVNMLSFTLPEGGNIYLSDIAFISPAAVDTPSFTSLPFIAVEDSYIESKETVQDLNITVTLSEASALSVSMRLETVIFHMVKKMMKLEALIVFEPGQDKVIVTFSIPSGALRGENGNSSLILVRGLSNALFQRDQATLFVTNPIK
ncbi:hypothetical protein QN399_01770 [Pseudomonas sp. 10C3]|nr:hypothetical protein [Pseudomonas sp. 10C3]MEE3505004.1 hypothetical protein [Pseudomonas sp. 10C3]